ncbi:MAG: UDP-N-acetyl-D-glucosamine dehydrogenase [Deltaproteobacteria bacterium]|nr:UDP-N-acetyl-D-glucosamine dehydrogenase [Deltaproteobacteria bacterium]
MPRRYVNHPPEKLRAAVIGVGYLGKFHAEKYARIPEVELVGLADPIEVRAREWAEKLGTRAYPDYRELLGKVDAVSVVVPTDQHFSVARAFLEAGSDVLLEKPIASTLREAEDLITTARTCRRILQVGHLERFNPAILAVRERVRAPLFIEVHRLTPFRGRGVEVDVVLDLMIHDLDIILSFVRSEAKGIQAVGVPVLTEKVDIANARVEFVGGCVANITASRVSREDLRRFRVFQPEAFLTVDYEAKTAAFFRRYVDSATGRIHLETEPIPVEAGDALEKEIRSFVQCSQRRASPPVTGEDGKRALALALRINEEIRKNVEKIPAIQSFYEKQEGLRGSSE